MTFKEFTGQQIMEDFVYSLQERQKLEDKIKQCKLNMFASPKDKSEPNEEFCKAYCQYCDLLRDYRRDYGHHAFGQLCDELR